MSRGLGYVYKRQIYNYLAGLGRGAGGEIQLTDAIAQLLQDQPVRAYQFDGIRFDCGSKLGYLEATLHYAMKHPTLGKPMAEYVRRIVAAD